jgi:hypothetical protein
MKKIITVLSVIWIVLLISACDADPYVGKRPIDFPNSIWICEEPIYMFIEYDENNELETGFLIEEDSIEISLMYSSIDDKVMVIGNEGNVLFRCHAEYLENECRLVVYESNQNEVAVGISFSLIMHVEE